MSGPKRTHALLAGPAALIAAALALTGCTTTEHGTGVAAAPLRPSSSSSARSAPTAPSTTPSSSGPTASGSAAALGQVLESIALKKDDLSSDYSLSLIDGGDQVTGQVTLDNCGYDFTSEDHRVARRQYAIVDSSQQDTGVSTELVAYDSTASATLALNEWNKSVATCPKTPVASGVAGVPDLTYAVTSNQAGDSALPVASNVVTVESATAQGQTEYLITVLQVRQQYLVAVYENLDVAPEQSDVDDLVSLAAITGKRLAALK